MSIPSVNRGPLDLHRVQRHVDRRAAYLDSDDRVQNTDCSLERLQEVVLVREHAVLACLDTNADTCVDVLGGRFEPCVALCLQNKSEVRHKRIAEKSDVLWCTCLKIWCSKASYAS